MIQENALKRITNFYLTSHDFNGIPVWSLREDLNISELELVKILINLITDNKISVVFGNICTNPHIKSFPDLEPQKQIEKIKQEGLQQDCIYPSKLMIEQATNVEEYNDRPFTRRLLLGAGQLEPVFFDLGVLERYFSDPRYSFEFYDFWGKACIASKFYDSTDIDKKDKIGLQTFGLGYDENRVRVVIVFLRYLNDLSPEHQQFWSTCIVSRKCKMVDYYYNSSFLAQFPEHISIYSAFLEEQVVINDLASLIGKPPFFKNTYKENHLKEFSFFLRPTLKNYNSFVHLLDKLISENINKDFFKGVIQLEERIDRGNGEFEIRQKNTLSLLEEWLSTIIVYPNESAKQQEILEFISPLKEVRKLRQKPAHLINEDSYDGKYDNLQRELIHKAYGSIRMIRLLFAKHPKAKAYDKISTLLLEGKIRNY
ncbi:MAG: AAA family ATPase [Candidatus Brocadiia bacterium]